MDPASRGAAPPGDTRLLSTTISPRTRTITTVTTTTRSARERRLSRPRTRARSVGSKLPDLVGGTAEYVLRRCGGFIHRHGFAGLRGRSHKQYPVMRPLRAGIAA